MPIRVVCHACGRQLNAPDHLAGRKAKCPKCQTVLPISAPVPAKTASPAPKERKLSKRRLPEPEERVTTEPEARDDSEPEEMLEVGRAVKKPKRKKRRRGPERSEPTTPAWITWLFVIGVFLLLAGSIAGGAIYKGHGFELLVYSVIFAIMIPLSTVILILSMFISSWMGGGIDFGEAHVVIPKAAGLLLIVNLIGLLPFGGFLAFPIWLVGLMYLFSLDLWETRILMAVNWGLNFLARMLVFTAIVAAFSHSHEGLGFNPSHRSGQPAAVSAEEEAINAIEELGGDCSTGNDEGDGPIVSVSLAGTRAADADLARLKSFPKLRQLDLSATQITDAGLVHLKKLNNLEMLTLARTRVTDAGVADLQAALPRLKIVR